MPNHRFRILIRLVSKEICHAAHVLCNLSSVLSNLRAEDHFCTLHASSALVGLCLPAILQENADLLHLV